MSADQSGSLNLNPGKGLAAGHSRRLIYLPIVHTQEDMGALKEPVVRATMARLGRAGLRRHLAAIEKIWSEIEDFIDSLALSFDRVRLYQDGLPICGREAEIVTELARAGNRNHRMLLRLMNRGAVLMGTESSDLLVQEYQMAKQSFTGRPPRSAGVAAQRRDQSASLLRRRDQFIAQRINETLKPGETGILFLGMLHSLWRYLPKNIEVIYPLHRPR
ncbi:MAG: hypothetical protein M1438_01210 [Deltaproteobacteria bacterium]|nr:hypothetical protein [Deltaproteobacteria bacterium]